MLRIDTTFRSHLGRGVMKEIAAHVGNAFAIAVTISAFIMLGGIFAGLW